MPFGLGQYTHFPGQPKLFVSNEITATPDWVRTDHLRQNFFHCVSAPSSSAANNSSLRKIGSAVFLRMRAVPYLNPHGF